MTKNIILGIYGMSQFYDAQKLYDCYEYPFPNVIDENLFAFSYGIMKVVSIALSRCDKCYFILDEIRVPLNPETSFTCRELRYVLNNPFIMDKITFLLNSEVVNKEYVIDNYKV